MRAKSIEEIVVKKIESGIRGIEHGTKKPHEVNILKDLARLSMINDGLFDELHEKYSKVLYEYDRKKVKELYK